jgi:hypothetical protein
MNSVLKVVKSALKLLILWWVVVYDKYKSPRPAVSGFQGRRKSTCAIRWLRSDTRAAFLLYRPWKWLVYTHPHPLWLWLMQANSGWNQGLSGEQGACLCVPFSQMLCSATPCRCAMDFPASSTLCACMSVTNVFCCLLPVAERGLGEGYPWARRPYTGPQN